MPEELKEKGLSRKRLLKRAGAGAAVLVAAPVLTSEAYAVHGGRHVCLKGDARCGPFSCQNQTRCRPPDGLCICEVTVPGGRCVCVDLRGAFCDNQPCGSEADCENLGPGWVCSQGCCPGPICVPRCDRPQAAGASGGAQKAGPQFAKA